MLALNKGSLRDAVAFCSIILLLLSDILYSRSTFGFASWFTLALPAVAFIYFPLSRRLPLNTRLLYSYGLILTLSVYAFLGAMLFSRPTLAAQSLVSLLGPVLLIRIGFSSNRNYLISALGAFIIATTIFALGQFLYGGFNLEGPFSLFRKFSEFMYEIQRDFLVDVIYLRPAGLFANPNTLGFFGGIGFWSLLGYGVRAHRPWGRLLLASAIACLLLSLSRGSLVAFGASISVYFLLNGFFGNPKGTKSIISGIGFVFFCASVIYLIAEFAPDKFERVAELSVFIEGDLSGSTNLTDRFNAWGAILHISDRYPFGTILPPQLVIAQSPDNQFIYYLAQGGLLLMVAVTLLFCGILVANRHESTPDRSLFFCAGIFVAVNAMTMVVMNSFIFMLFWILVGCVCRRPLVPLAHSNLSQSFRWRGYSQ